ncbi:YhdP family protein [Polynucleobacter sp. HIN9]|uniref:YhdP family protein n=1 Tax=Polynucleobacter sp. HIN9 TaxID=3047868 RepID=UPI0025725735|nr:YhdP family protein [Polynucleobacter sp. HIN9]BEI41542.1 YhdP family protein [Polynucleobacter sp. HIN9]
MTEKKYPLRLKDLLRMRPDATSWSRWSRRLAILALITVGLMILGHLVIRFIIWPQLETSKPAVEKLLSQRIGVEVKINELNVYWQGIRPVFDIRDLEFVVDSKRNPTTIADAPPLKIADIRGELSWSSFYHLKPYFTKLHASNAVIQVTRDSQKRLYVAGILAGDGGDDFHLENWLFKQGDLKISDINILWKDFSKSKADAADLRIESMQLRNGIRQHELDAAIYSPWHQGTLTLSGKFSHRLGGQAGHWRDWIGDFQWKVAQLNLGQFSRDFEIPFKQLSGVLDSSGSIALNKGIPDGGQFKLAIEQPVFQQLKSNQALEFGRLEMEAKQFTSGKFISLGVQQFAWLNKNQKPGTPMESLAPMTFGWQAPKGDGELERFAFSSAKISLENLSLFALNLPIPNRIRQVLEQTEPRGELIDVDITWAEPKSNIPLIGGLLSGQGPKFNITGTLNQVGIKAYRDTIPSIANLSGTITTNQSQGSIKLNSQNLRLVIADFLAEPRLQFDSASGALSWSLKNKQWQIGFNQLSVNNPDIALIADGNYLIGKEKAPDTLDLTIQFPRAKAQTIYRYLPAEMSKDARAYIEKAFIGGEINNGRLRMKGDPNLAPYDAPGSGEFALNLPISQTVFRPAPLFPSTKGSWPEFTEVNGVVSMQQAKLMVAIKDARYQGLQIQNVNAEIPNVSSAKPVLNLKGNITGPMNDMMDYLRTTPILLTRPELAKNLKLSGPAKLDLDLLLPLQNTDDVKLNALLNLDNNVVVWSDLAPFNQVRGSIRITEDLPRFEQVSAEFFGGTINIRQNTAQSQTKQDLYDLNGTIDLERLERHYANQVGRQSQQLLKALDGKAAFKGKLGITSNTTDLNLDLDFNALSTTLPEPLSIKKGNKLNGIFRYQSNASEGAPKRIAQWSAQIGKSITLQGKQGPDGIVAQGIGIGAPAIIPERGLGLNLQASDLNIDAWHRLLFSNDGVNNKPEAANMASSTDGVNGLQVFTARVNQAIAMNRSWPNLAVSAKLGGDTWQLNLKSPNLEGDIQYQERKNSDLLKGKLLRLHIPPRLQNLTNSSASADKEVSLNAIPELDLSIDDFNFNQYKPGAIAIKTRNSTNRITIESLKINNPSSSSTVTGEWTSDAQGNNERVIIDTTSQVKDLGTVVAYWGNPKAVEGGKGTINAKLDWSGPPYNPSFDTLAGNVKINLENGRLLQVDSGFAKIIGVFSLQSLLKFATFDIQGSLGSVVTSGTAFNTLSGDFVLRNGVARTQNFTMQLNQARVATSGLVNIPKQTQDLRITIFPTIDATAGALALFAVNPIVGASALIGQYLISNQLNRTLQTDYLVQGSWDKPDVIPLDQNGQPLDPKVLETIRSRNLLREQKMPPAPSPSKPVPTTPAPAN